MPFSTITVVIIMKISINIIVITTIVFLIITIIISTLTLKKTNIIVFHPFSTNKKKFRNEADVIYIFLPPKYLALCVYKK